MSDQTLREIVDAIVAGGAEVVVIVRRDRSPADGVAVDAPPADPPDRRIQAVRTFRSARQS